MSSSSFQSHCRPAKGLMIVMVGHIGVGKSATGNTVLGRPAFRSRVSSTAVTRMCQMESAARDGENLTVVDTPALGDAQSQADVMREVHRCVSRAPGGPVVFLVVVQSGRFTRDEQQTVRWIQSAFGPQAAHYTMALFTRADDLRAEGRSVDQLIGADPAVRDFIRECCGGYHALDNRDSDPSQVVELLQKINSLVQRNGGSDGARVVLRGEAPERGAAGGDALRDALVLRGEAPERGAAGGDALRDALVLRGEAPERGAAGGDALRDALVLRGEAPERGAAGGNALRGDALIDVVLAGCLITALAATLVALFTTKRPTSPSAVRI